MRHDAPWHPEKAASRQSINVPGQVFMGPYFAFSWPPKLLSRRIVRHSASLCKVCETGGTMKRLQRTSSSLGHARLWVTSQTTLQSWYVSASRAVTITLTLLLHVNHPGSSCTSSQAFLNRTQLAQAQAVGQVPWEADWQSSLRCFDVFRRQPFPVMLRSWQP